MLFALLVIIIMDDSSRCKSSQLTMERNSDDCDDCDDCCCCCDCDDDDDDDDDTSLT